MSQAVKTSMKMLELTGLYEASEDSFNPAEIQVDNFLKEVKELIDCRLQEKNISLDVFCEPKELVKKFDQDLMISVVTNLIDNAVKASRKESKLCLRQPRTSDGSGFWKGNTERGSGNGDGTILYGRQISFQGKRKCRARSFFMSENYRTARFPTED